MDAFPSGPPGMAGAYANQRPFLLSLPSDSQGDGHDEVVACAWDGQTYIIDHNRTVARFQVDENVSAFCAGEKEACPIVPCLRHPGLTANCWVPGNRRQNPGVLEEGINSMERFVLEVGEDPLCFLTLGGL